LTQQGGIVAKKGNLTTIDPKKRLQLINWLILSFLPLLGAPPLF
jgi:hypothetical protein